MALVLFFDIPTESAVAVPVCTLEARSQEDVAHLAARVIQCEQVRGGMKNSRCSGWLSRRPSSIRVAQLRLGATHAVARRKHGQSGVLNFRS
jgi:hypothetical protein